MSNVATTPELIKVLAIDDELDFLKGLARLLGPRGFEVRPFESADAALEHLAGHRDELDLVLIDRNLSHGVDGLQVLGRARNVAPDVPYLMLSGDTSESTAASALRSGAFHFLTKPIGDIDAVALTLLRAANFSRLQRRARNLEHRVGVDQKFEKLVGTSAAMRELFLMISKVSDTDLNVLIHGESGTGKELTARAIHERSARASGPFIALNCGAIPESLIDSELFGHTKGAFTGAVEARAGVFLEAQGGTLFLDEIGELPAGVQTRLLRVLQEREVRAIGGSGTRPIDVRVVAATHVDLAAMVEDRRFRADLYYRLNVVTVDLAPLRERIEDIPLLIAHLLEKHAARQRRPVPRMSQELVEVLLAHRWPGNVRELENVIQAALALGRSDTLGLEALPPSFTARPAGGRAGGGAASKATPGPSPSVGGEIDPGAPVEEYKSARRDAIESFDLAYFTALLERTQGNLSEASRLSGVDRSNLRRALARLGLRTPRSEGGDDLN